MLVRILVYPKEVFFKIIISSPDVSNYKNKYDYNMDWHFIIGSGCNIANFNKKFRSSKDVIAYIISHSPPDLQCAIDMSGPNVSIVTSRFIKDDDVNYDNSRYVDWNDLRDVLVEQGIYGE